LGANPTSDGHKVAPEMGGGEGFGRRVGKPNVPPLIWCLGVPQRDLNKKRGGPSCKEGELRNRKKKKKEKKAGLA